MKELLTTTRSKPASAMPVERAHVADLVGDAVAEARSRAATAARQRGELGAHLDRGDQRRVAAQREVGGEGAEAGAAVEHAGAAQRVDAAELGEVAAHRLDPARHQARVGRQRALGLGRGRVEPVAARSRRAPRGRRPGPTALVPARVGDVPLASAERRRAPEIRPPPGVESCAAQAPPTVHRPARFDVQRVAAARAVGVQQLEHRAAHAARRGRRRREPSPRWSSRSSERTCGAPPPAGRLRRGPVEPARRAAGRRSTSRSSSRLRSGWLSTCISPPARW